MPVSSHSENLKRLGDFEIIRELGRGGMGVVYEAWQVSLNRKVALKELSVTLGLTANAIQRFRREAEAAAKLHHTNIVPVYVTGEQDGRFFYAMELIDGSSLDLVIKQLKQLRGSKPSDGQPLHEPTQKQALASTGPYQEDSIASLNLSASSLSSDSHYFDTVAKMVAEMADALEYAHKEGVIHRDIKPSNLLLSRTGRLSINDFGLARMLEQPGMTASGEFVGTPLYMSPEQIAAGRTPLDHRTDIYSLGAALYELLTLRPPFSGEGRDQVLAQILHKEPIAPRKLNRKVPIDLETICLKALEKDPDRRYQTAGEMAEDLRRYVNRFAIRAKRVGTVGRLLKWIRRKPAVASSLGGLLIAVIAAVGLAYTAYRTEWEKRLEREHAADRLRDEQERGRQLLLDEKIRSAYLIAAGGDLVKTDEAIKEIESLGASTGQVRLLRGVAAYFRQETETAVSELEQAVKLLPDNVAARALLMISYADYGQPDRSEPLYVELNNLTPVSAEDFLFKGYSRLSFDPLGGLPELNEGIRQHDSPLGRALRAVVWVSHAEETGSLDAVEKALADAAVARGMLPDNPADDAGIEIVESESGKRKLRVSDFGQSTIRSIRFSADDSAIALLQQKHGTVDDFSIRLLDLPSGKETVHFQLPKRHWLNLHAWEGHHLTVFSQYTENSPEYIMKAFTFDLESIPVGQETECQELERVENHGSNANEPYKLPWYELGRGASWRAEVELAQLDEKWIQKQWNRFVELLGANKLAFSGLECRLRVWDGKNYRITYKSPWFSNSGFHMATNGATYAVMSDARELSLWKAESHLRWPWALVLSVGILVVTLLIGRWRWRREGPVNISPLACSSYTRAPGQS